jgi:hypothetical protein
MHSVQVPDSLVVAETVAPNALGPAWMDAGSADSIDRALANGPAYNRQ